jgi:hypothetical protein
MAEGLQRASPTPLALQWAQMAASTSQTTTLCAASPEASTQLLGARRQHTTHSKSTHTHTRSQDTHPGDQRP